MIRLFISEWVWVGRYDWLQTTAEHDVIWSVWAWDHRELSCAHLNLNTEWQFYMISRVDRCLFGMSSWLSTRSSTPMRQTRSTAAWLPDSCTRLADCFKQTVKASRFPTLGQFTEQPSCTILLWQIEIFNQNHIFLWNFHDFVFLFYWYLGLDSFPR